MNTLTWQGSDPDPAAQASTTARMDALHQPRPLSLDTRTEEWWQEAPGLFDTLVAINMIHITSRAGVEGLFRGAAAILTPGGHLFLYGPFSRRGVTEESNRSFDASLKARDPSWGVRDLDDMIQPLGARFAFELTHVERVPANNHVVLFKSQAHGES